jgi:hypothetical protein
MIKLAFRGRRGPGDRTDAQSASRARRLARWANAYTLAAYNPNVPYRRPQS